MWFCFASHLHQVRVLAVDGQGFAVLLAAQEQETLIALDDGLGDVVRARQAARVAPGDEGAQVKIAPLDGVCRVVVVGEPGQEAQQVVVQAVRVAQVADRELGLADAFLRHGGLFLACRHRG